jgi:hypothetical protein
MVYPSTELLVRLGDGKKKDWNSSVVQIKADSIDSMVSQINERFGDASQIVLGSRNGNTMDVQLYHHSESLTSDRQEYWSS